MYDENYHKKAFFSNYKMFLNLKLLKNDKPKYVKKLELVGQMMQGLNFNKNVLFIYNKFIPKDVFLVAAGAIDKFKNSVFYGSINDISDLHFKAKNSGYDSGDRYHSEHDITDELMCIHVNYNSDNHKAYTTYLTNTIMRRYENRDRSNKVMLNWIFFYGNIDAFNKDPIYASLKNIFNDEELSNDFMICDLNELSKVNKENNNIDPDRDFD